MRIGKWIFALALLVPALVLASAPDLTLKDPAGKNHKLSEYIGNGKWTIVMIWAHDCPICNAEVYQMTFFHDDHKDKDATVLGVSIDGFADRDKAKAFIDRHSLNFPNLIAEPEGAVIAKFGGAGFIGTPTFYYYRPNGEFAGQHVGPLDMEQAERTIKQLGKTGG